VSRCCMMAVTVGIEGPRLSQQALLDLERSKVSPVELLEEVAQILGVNYPHIRSAFVVPGQGNKTSLYVAHCAPKEQWILRWLLKRTELLSIGSKIKVSSEDSLR
jgi:nucleolar pre-ribosomal-associated protein 2